MNITSLELINYRNFKNSKIEFKNNNIIIGDNDTGKSNLIFALRLIFDNNTRTYKFLETDFHEKNIDEKIQIIVTLEIPNSLLKYPNDYYDQKFRMCIKEGIVDNVAIINTKVFIKLEVIYNKEDSMLEPFFFWGSDIDSLKEIKQFRLTNEIDKVFEGIFLDSKIALSDSFKSQRWDIRDMILENLKEDQEIMVQIDSLKKTLDSNVKKLPSIKKIEEKINTTLSSLDSSFKVSVTSKLVVKDNIENLDIFIKDYDSSEIYPVSGDGRNKKTAYALKNSVFKEPEFLKYKIYLIEEPENHLFYKSQSQLIKWIFNISNNFFTIITTHSTNVLFGMVENTNVVKLSKKENKVATNSSVYQVPDKFGIFLEQYNKNIAIAMFYENVILVEGISEEILFNFLLKKNYKNSFFQYYVLSVNGIDFKPYFDFLRNLGIKVFAKTDNDIIKSKSKKIDYDNNVNVAYSGINRCLKLLNLEEEKYKNISLLKSIYENEEQFNDYKRAILRDKLTPEIKDKMLESHIYLSNIDLETDLLVAITTEEMSKIIGIPNSNFYKMLKIMQKQKWRFMVDFVQKINSNNEIFEKINALLKNNDAFSFLFFLE